jgi:hypothetical protein
VIPTKRKIELAWRIVLSGKYRPEQKPPQPIPSVQSGIDRRWNGRSISSGGGPYWDQRKDADSFDQDIGSYRTIAVRALEDG